MPLPPEPRRLRERGAACGHRSSVVGSTDVSGCLGLVGSAALDLARLQFAMTTVYHFLFVPVTIGMAWFVAGMQTLWHLTGNSATCG